VRLEGIEPPALRSGVQGRQLRLDSPVFADWHLVPPLLPAFRFNCSKNCSKAEGRRPYLLIVAGRRLARPWRRVAKPRPGPVEGDSAPLSKSGSRSAPFGHTSVPSSGSTRTERKTLGSRRASNTGPQRSLSRSTTRSEPLSNLTRKQ